MVVCGGVVVVRGGVWWYVVVCGGVWWCVVVCGGWVVVVWWLCGGGVVVCGGVWWCPVVCDGMTRINQNNWLGSRWDHSQNLENPP